MSLLNGTTELYLAAGRVIEGCRRRAVAGPLLLGAGRHGLPGRAFLSDVHRVLPSASVVGRPCAVAGAPERAGVHADGSASVPSARSMRSEAAALPPSRANLRGAVLAAPGVGGFSSVSPVPSQQSQPDDGAVIARLRAEEASLRAELSGLPVAGLPRPCCCSSEVHGLMLCVLKPESYTAAFEAISSNVLYLHDVLVVRDVRFFETAGKGLGGSSPSFWSPGTAMDPSWPQSRGYPGRSCVVSIDLSLVVICPRRPRPRGGKSLAVRSYEFRRRRQLVFCGPSSMVSPCSPRALSSPPSGGSTVTAIPLY